MSKKLISLLLAVCMLFCLSACGATETSGNVNNTLSESQTDTTQNTEETKENNSGNLGKKIIGEWKLTAESKSAFSDDYPGSCLTFYADGSWDNYGDYSNQYFISGNTITMNSSNWFSEMIYTVSIDDNVLKLQYKGYPPVYYDKIS